MRTRFVDLLRWDGTTSRSVYALAGVLLFVLKHNLDRFVASFFFGRSWSVFNYYVLPTSGEGPAQLNAVDTRFYSTLLALALPFIAVGVQLTVRRLRDAGLPVWLAIFFFLPFVNLLFFVALAVIPTRATHPPFRPWATPSFLDRLIPDHPVGSAAAGVLVTTALAVVLVVLGASVLKNYGWGLFVGIPFCLGLTSVLVYGYHARRELVPSIAVACLSVAFLGFALAALAIEGLICIAMAAPIGVFLSTLGGLLGYLIQRRAGGARREAPALVLALAVALPLMMGAEAREPAPAPVVAVTTAIEIDAPPEAVWRHVVAFSELPEPDSWIFRSGIAYPQRAEIEGEGPGAVRRCVFSTGPFVEPIEVWDEPRLLKFSVTEQPPAMRELSPYASLATPHLDDYLVSEGGQFLLTELPGGRTRLEGTTWYRHQIWPAQYWRVWSDAIIHRIHLRVLEHVERLSEGAAERS